MIIIDRRKLIGGIGALACSKAAAQVPNSGGFTPASTYINNSIFLETDLCSDIDDAAAVSILISSVQAGQCKLVGVNANSSSDYSAPCLQAILNQYNLGQIPVGAYQGNDMPSVSSYIQQTAANYGQSGKTRANFISGVTNLRTVLANQPNNSVTILSIGFLTNLQALLQSSGDSISPLTGLQLVAAKVRMFVIMGGVYTTGTEYNFSNGPSYANYVVSNIPSQINNFGVDFNFGNSVVWTFPSGSSIFSYMYNLYRVANGNPTQRQGWDLLAALYASWSQNSLFNFAGPFGTNSVNNSTGINTWTSTLGNYTYLGNAQSFATIGSALNVLVNLLA